MILAWAALVCVLPGVAVAGSWQAHQFVDNFIDLGTKACDTSAEHLVWHATNSTNVDEAKEECKKNSFCAGVSGSGTGAYSLVVSNTTEMRHAVLDMDGTGTCAARLSDRRGLVWNLDGPSPVYMSYPENGVSNLNISTICQNFFESVPEAVSGASTERNENKYVEATVKRVDDADSIASYFKTCKEAVYPKYTFIGMFIFFASDKYNNDIKMTCQYYFSGTMANFSTSGKPSEFKDKSEPGFTVGFNDESDVFCISPQQITTTFTTPASSAPLTTTAATNAATDKNGVSDTVQGILIASVVVLFLVVGFVAVKHRPGNRKHPSSDETPVVDYAVG